MGPNCVDRAISVPDTRSIEPVRILSSETLSAPTKHLPNSYNANICVVEISLPRDGNHQVPNSPDDLGLGGTHKSWLLRRHQHLASWLPPRGVWKRAGIVEHTATQTGCGQQPKDHLPYSGFCGRWFGLLGFFLPCLTGWEWYFVVSIQTRGQDFHSIVPLATRR